ncbi:MAG: hypothetical protein KDN05_22125, partial [Verrucomicrobiae bacterium]|nr:hypothetical protein [Verrucomicrobiae bacterium]
FSPRPDRSEVESGVRRWLETHLPGEADEVFAKALEVTLERERFQAENRIRSMTQQEVVRDADLLRELGQVEFGAFPEFLPQALEIAQRIKDPTQRGEVIRQLEAQTQP